MEEVGEPKEAGSTCMFVARHEQRCRGATHNSFPSPLYRTIKKTTSVDRGGVQGEKKEGLGKRCVRTQSLYTVEIVRAHKMFVHCNAGLKMD